MGPNGPRHKHDNGGAALRGQLSREAWREHRRRRFRRHSRRAYIRSAYSLPSLATLGNAVCGFGAMYVCGLDPEHLGTRDQWTMFFANHHFTVAAYLIFLAMVFDALDGRLARFTRHTTDFGGQLDSLADAISFGVAPAFLGMQLFRQSDLGVPVPVVISRLVWAIGALYACCALIRLARFNVSNEHGEQHHFSFLGLPSPGAGGTVASFVLMEQALEQLGSEYPGHRALGPAVKACVWMLPAIVLLTGLLMVSTIRYPHIINRYLRGRQSFWTLLVMVAFLLTIIVAHRYVLALATLIYVLTPLVMGGLMRLRGKPARVPAPAPSASNTPAAAPPT
jgi:CDP-diacylglycerol--serine O-phosphatidyltransferase